MAHLAKYKTTQVHGMNRHWSRYNWNYSNENINKELTHLNYNLAPARGKTWLNDMVEEHRNKHASKKNLNVLCDWVVTMPKEITDEDIQKRFFELTYEFLKSRYDTCDNIHSAYVHRDETTPHLHFAFIPITDKGNISADKVITRQDLRTFHDDFQAYIDDHLKYSCKVVHHDNISRSKSLNDYKKEKQMLRNLSPVNVTEEQKSKLSNTYKITAEQKEKIDLIDTVLQTLIRLYEQIQKDIERKSQERCFTIKQSKQLQELESVLIHKYDEFNTELEKTVQNRTESLTEENKKLKTTIVKTNNLKMMISEALDTVIKKNEALEKENAKLNNFLEQHNLKEEYEKQNKPKRRRKQIQIVREEEEWER